MQKFAAVLLGCIFVTNIFANEDTAIKLNEIKLISESFSRIKTNYIDEVENKKLVENCISGMAAGLDSSSQYISKEKFQELRTGYRKDLGGIGLTLMIKNGLPLVISPIEDTPAYKAGIMTNDVIIEVDGNNVLNLGLDEVVSLLRGKVGERVNLSVIRQQATQISFNLKREQIHINNIKSRQLKHGIGYIRITSFLNSTARKFKKELNQLIFQETNSLKGLIIDLRNNPGGLLREAVAVADLFIPSGLIAYTEARNYGAEIKFEAKENILLENIPIVVLVNDGSAAASEIVAGALKAHNRATIIGSKTFGSGSIQTIIPLLNGGALKLTTSRWRLPNGAYIDGQGIEPDILVNRALNYDNDIQLERALNYLNNL